MIGIFLVCKNLDVYQQPLIKSGDQKKGCFKKPASFFLSFKSPGEISSQNYRFFLAK